MNKFFINFELAKLNISYPDLTNILMHFLFMLIILLSTKRNGRKSQKLLSIVQTEQLRGLAIFFVLLGHLWVHVSKSRPGIVLSGDAVSMFLILSGFGLTVSSGLKKLDYKQFISKRINRIMVPYWIATLVILLLDFFILRRTLPVNDTIMTFLGLNFSLELRHLDYVRWFVTFILLWYTIFFIGQNTFSTKNRIYFFLFIASILLPLNYYLFDFGWYYFFSFPFGCIIAIYYEDLKRIFNKKRSAILIASIIGICYVMAYKTAFNDQHFRQMVGDIIPNIFLKYVREGNSILLNMGIIFICGHLGEKGFENKLLIALGRYSYELFLLHGVFLIKYNPLFRSSNNFAIVIGFSVLILFLFGLSIILSKVSNLKYVKKAL